MPKRGRTDGKWYQLVISKAHQKVRDKYIINCCTAANIRERVAVLDTQSTTHFILTVVTSSHRVHERTNPSAANRISHQKMSTLAPNNGQFAFLLIFLGVYRRESRCNIHPLYIISDTVNLPSVR